MVCDAICGPHGGARECGLRASASRPDAAIECIFWLAPPSSLLCRPRPLLFPAAAVAFVARAGSVSAFSAYARHRSARRAVKAQRAVVGMSLEEIKKKKAQKPEVRSAQREAALREVKERNKKAKEAKKVAVAKSMAKEKVAKSKGGKAPSKGTQR